MQALPPIWRAPKKVCEMWLASVLPLAHAAQNQTEASLTNTRLRNTRLKGVFATPSLALTLALPGARDAAGLPALGRPGLPRRRRVLRGGSLVAARSDGS